MGTKKGKLLLCLAALLCEILSSAVGCGFVGDADIAAYLKFLALFPMFAAPVLTVVAMINLGRKEKEKSRK